MTDHRTTLLSERLDRLADDMTPQLDVATQVRTARNRHRRQRRIRLASVAVVTAAAAVALGTTTAVDLLNADRGTEVAVPSDPTTTAAPEATPALPEGWEPRQFRGVTFAVPPGARTADTVQEPAKTSFIEGPSVTWNGPDLGGGVFSYVTVEVRANYQGGLTPLDGGDWYEVPGAEKAYGGIDKSGYVAGDGNRYLTTTLWLYVLVGDHEVVVSGEFAAPPEGEQTAQQVIDSLSVDALAGDGPDEDGVRVDQQVSGQDDDERERLAAAADDLSEVLGRDPILTGQDPSQTLPCPDVAAYLGDSVGSPLIAGPGPTSLDGCSWSTSPDTAEDSRLMLTLRNDPEMNRDQVERDVNSAVALDGCYPSALPGGPGFSALTLCPVGSQTLWTVTILDGGGTGAWVLTASVGSATPEDTGVAAIIALRDAVRSR